LEIAFKECWGNTVTQPLPCNKQDCFFSTVVFGDMIENSRRHQIWEAFQTESVADVLSFSACGNVLVIDSIKEINVDDLNYGSHLKLDELSAGKDSSQNKKIYLQALKSQ
jgi:hypothetical protein